MCVCEREEREVGITHYSPLKHVYYSSEVSEMWWSVFQMDHIEVGKYSPAHTHPYIEMSPLVVAAG